ncbi:MAG: NAD(P)H-dependent oxidoreductase [Sarcina sp.]
MRKILMLNLSPKGVKSTSMSILESFKKKFEKKSNVEEFDLSIKTLREFSKDRKKLLRLIEESDDVIFASPLYVDTLPAFVIEFLDYLDENFKSEKVINLYGIVNCGFLEEYYNLPALNLFENFAKEVGFNWRIGLGIGAGGWLVNAENATGMQAKMKADINFAFDSFTQSFFNTAALNDKNITATAKMPKRVYAFAATQSFKKLAKENKIKIKAKPHDLKIECKKDKVKSTKKNDYTLK